MSPTLEVALITVLAILALALIALVVLAWRTTHYLDELLLSSRRDLSQIAEDIRVSRLRLDRLEISLQTAVEEVMTTIRVVGELASSVQDFQYRCQRTINTTARILGGLIGGASAVLSFFKSKRNPSHT